MKQLTLATGGFDRSRARQHGGRRFWRRWSGLYVADTGRVAWPSQNHIELRFPPESDLPINVSGLFYRESWGPVFWWAGSKHAMGPASLLAATGMQRCVKRWDPFEGATRIGPADTTLAASSNTEVLSRAVLLVSRPLAGLVLHKYHYLENLAAQNSHSCVHSTPISQALTRPMLADLHRAALNTYKCRTPRG
jgi:hypothetical protein